ncbi:MAG: GNAT family N-acetyltransferase [Alphaproteobacteria bacterium HGW-Alphaproteobacteria-1]|jgi:GNAT superfamily N-acetyltransferase|nr:MAG: GNAT family N-acetyltransferase [Alphaproteobacteria bacterium HGW-Alphaproteobacteria-1]
MPHDAQTIRQVAELHASGISQGFLSSLGPRFLNVLYRAIDLCDTAVLIVEKDGPRVTGFVTGGCGMGPVYRQMLRDWPSLGLSLAPVLVQPRKIKGILEILRRRDASGDAGILPRHELFSIAVAPAFRGSGTAERLYRALNDHFRAIRVPAYRIVVGESLLPAHRFYTRMGAKPVETVRIHGASTSTIYVQDL